MKKDNLKDKNILVVGGIHGDEPTGIEVAKYFSKQTGNIDGLICHNKAIKKGKRYLETDLNRSFDCKEPISIEEIMAKKIKEKISSIDFIIDIHNTKSEDTLCSIVTAYPNYMQVYISHFFALRDLVIMPPSGSLISNKKNNSISLEIPTNRIRKYSSKTLIKKIKLISKHDFEAHHNSSINIYEYVNKVTSKTLKRVGLYKKDFANFQRLTKVQVVKLNLELGNGYFPIFLKQDEDEDPVLTLVRFIKTENLVNFKQ